MKKMIILAVVLVIALAFAFGQTTPVPDEEKEAIIKTALDYGDGFYSGSAERMERAIHPDLNKVWARAFPQTGKTVLSYSTFSLLVEMSRAKVGFLDESARKIKVEVFEVNDDLACAKLMSARYNDYLQLVKIDGQWKIVNVLWTLGPDTPNRPVLQGFNPENEKEPVKRAVLDYFEGVMAGDAVRAEKVLHPEVSRAVFNKLPQTGKYMISRNRFSILIEPIRAKLAVQPEDKRNVEVRVLDVMDGMAFVAAKAANGANYLQLAWIDGQWKIINILTKPNPAPQPPPKK